MPQVLGILETALYVADVQRAAEFYRRVFGFGTLLESDRLIALDVAEKNVLLLFKAGATAGAFDTGNGIIPGHSTTGTHHFAFSVPTDELDAWKERLPAEGVLIESTVRWPGGAESVYFRDPDGHLGELLTPGFWRIY